MTPRQKTQVQTTLVAWLDAPEHRYVETRRPVPQTAVSLFDDYAISLMPWAQKGYRCISFVEPMSARKRRECVLDGIEVVEIENLGKRVLIDVLPRLSDVAFIVCLPPCRDLCAAGARWWKKKAAADPGFQSRAANELNTLLVQLDETHIPYAVLVPASSRLRALVDRSVRTISPHEFGRYIPPNTPHPVFPSVIPANDAYTKRTFLYSGGGFVLPWKLAVPPTFTRIRLKSGKVKRITPVMASRKTTQSRRVPPLGLCIAVADVHSTESSVAPEPTTQPVC